VMLSTEISTAEMMSGAMSRARSCVLIWVECTEPAMAIQIEPPRSWAKQTSPTACAVSSGRSCVAAWTAIVVFFA
jgi:hypothetical protein